MTEQPQQHVPVSFDAALMEFSELLDGIRSCVNGQRVQLISEGWSVDAAEQISVAVYGVLLAALVTPVKGNV